MDHDSRNPNHPQDTSRSALRWILLAVALWPLVVVFGYRLFFGG